MNLSALAGQINAHDIASIHCHVIMGAAKERKIILYGSGILVRRLDFAEMHTSTHLFSARDAACSAAALAELAACNLASKLVAMRTVAIISSSVRALPASRSLAICEATMGQKASDACDLEDYWEKIDERLGMCSQVVTALASKASRETCASSNLVTCESRESLFAPTAKPAPLTCL